MNYRMTAYLLGQIAIIVAALLLIPFIMAFAYGETGTPLSFGITIAALLALGIPCVIKKPQNTEIRARGGFIIVALAWLLLSAFGAMPFRISGAIPNYIDALFETASGFTTTGSSILTNVEALPKSLLFWRSFTHWIGGMGVLVFAIAVLPKSNAAIVHVMKAEVPGPQFGKLVSKLRFTARILYAIYVALTLIEVVFLLCGKMSVFDAFINAFGTAGTGGFSNHSASIGYYNSVYIEVVITVFMLLFSINFNLFFFILLGHFSDAIRNEELHALFGIYVAAVAMLVTSLMIHNVYSFAEALRYATFQTASILSTTGYATADFTMWPTFSQVILVILMFIGGSAGSTAGGLKVSRVLILAKSSVKEVKKSLSPRSVLNIKLDKKPLDNALTNSVASYFALYIIILMISVALISIVGKFNGDRALVTNFTAVIACLNNIGPGLGEVGPMGSFAEFSIFAKIVLTLDMLIGRLEIMPMLLLFYPKTWKKA